MIKVWVAVIFGLMPDGNINMTWSSKPFETYAACVEFSAKEATPIMKKALEDGITPKAECYEVAFAKEVKASE